MFQLKLQVDLKFRKNALDRGRLIEKFPTFSGQPRSEITKEYCFPVFQTISLQSWQYFYQLKEIFPF